MFELNLITEETRIDLLGDNNTEPVEIRTT